MLSQIVVTSGTTISNSMIATLGIVNPQKVLRVTVSFAIASSSVPHPEQSSSRVV